MRSQGLKLARGNQMKAAGVGRGERHQLAPKTRGDRIAWVESQGSTPGFQPFLTQLERLRRDLNQRAYLGLRRFELQCSYHEAGSPGYKRHTDTFADHGARRRLSAVYYLNPTWRPEHGGSLTIHLPSGPLEVEPVHNRLVLFLSDIEHEVAPVQAPRLALTAWFYCQ
ncbi:MAG: 2OG-Fe(II) oxygenase [Vulcanimicrobiota bacterium]